MVDAAHDARDDEHARARLPADEGHLLGAVDRDDGIRYGPQPIQGGGERRALEPIGELPRYDVSRLDADPGEPAGHALGARREIGEGVATPALALPLDQERALGCRADARRE